MVLVCCFGSTPKVHIPVFAKLVLFVKAKIVVGSQARDYGCAQMLHAVAWVAHSHNVVPRKKDLLPQRHHDLFNHLHHKKLMYLLIHKEL